MSAWSCFGRNPLNSERGKEKDAAIRSRDGAGRSVTGKEGDENEAKISDGWGKHG